jgi:hypothetical protein
VKEPVDHILRPRLPWRSASEPAITECGYDASKVKVLTREDFQARLKDLGQQRTALLTCMTCADASKRWPTWEQEPRGALEREITWEYAWGREKRGHRLKDELVAIVALIDAHPEQFASLLGELEQRREWIEKKKQAQQKPPEPPSPFKWRPI